MLLLKSLDPVRSDQSTSGRIVIGGLLVIYWGAMFIGTHLPQGVGPGGSVNDKLLHFTAYAGLGFLLAAAISSLRVRLGPLLAAVGIAAVYGAFDELTQVPVPGRQAEWADWTADLLGAAAGVLAFSAVATIWQRCGATVASPSTSDA